MIKTNSVHTQIIISFWGLCRFSNSMWQCNVKKVTDGGFSIEVVLWTEDSPCLEKLPSVVRLRVSTQLYKAVLLYDYCIDSVFTELLFIQLVQFRSFLRGRIDDSSSLSIPVATITTKVKKLYCLSKEIWRRADRLLSVWTGEECASIDTRWFK